MHSWLPHWLGGQGGRARAEPLSIGFYVPEDERSLASLRRHLKQLDWAVPAIVSVSGPDHALHVAQDPGFDRLIANARHAPRVLPMVQNIGAGSWEGASTARLLADRVASRSLAAQLAALVARRNQAGLVMDFEALPPGSMDDYLRFLRDLRAALSPSPRRRARRAGPCVNWGTWPTG